jgi:disulfide bond formation protein DsbB
LYYRAWTWGLRLVLVLGGSRGLVLVLMLLLGLTLLLRLGGFKLVAALTLLLGLVLSGGHATSPSGVTGQTSTWPWLITDTYLSVENGRTRAANNARTASTIATVTISRK